METVLGFSQTCTHSTCPILADLAKAIVMLLAFVFIYKFMRKEPLDNKLSTFLAILCLSPLLVGIYGYIASIFDVMTFWPLYIGIAITIVLLVILVMIKHFTDKFKK